MLPVEDVTLASIGLVSAVAPQLNVVCTAPADPLRPCSDGGQAQTDAGSSGAVTTATAALPALNASMSGGAEVGAGVHRGDGRRRPHRHRGAERRQDELRDQADVGGAPGGMLCG